MNKDVKISLKESSDPTNHSLEPFTEWNEIFSLNKEVYCDRNSFVTNTLVEHRCKSNFYYRKCTNYFTTLVTGRPRQSPQS